MKKFGKKYVEASNKVEKNKLYTVEEAINLVKETATNSRDAEEALLYNEMQEELIIQLLNRLSTIKPHIHAY